MTTKTDTNALRELADLLDASPDLPHPYLNGYAPVQADWFLHIHGAGLLEQKETATQIVRGIGGQWDKTESGEDLRFIQATDNLILRVTVARDAVCQRVVVGTHEVTVPAVPAMKATRAVPARTELVEDVEWVCGSLLANTDLVSA